MLKKLPKKLRVQSSLSQILILALTMGPIFTGLLSPSFAAAADAKVLILGAEVVDAETGQRLQAILNPSGEVKMTFTTWGISLSYEGADNKTASVALHADFSEAATDEKEAGVNLRNRMLNDMLRAGGSIQAGDVIKTMPEQLAAEGIKVGLSFNTKNRTGFVISDFGFSEVMVHAEGKPRLSLHQIVKNIISSRVDQQLAMMAAARAAQAPITAETVQLRMCQAMFKSTAP